MRDDAARRQKRRQKWLTLLYASALILLVAAADQGWLKLAFLAGLPAVDKAGHFFLMGGLSFLVNTSLQGRRCGVGRIRPLQGNLRVGALVAVEELSQLGLAQRSFELADLLADAAGIWLFGRLADARLQARAARIARTP